MKKLSKSLRELADHVANMEKKVAAIEHLNAEKAEASIASSKADAKVRQDEFKAEVINGESSCFFSLGRPTGKL